MKNIIAIIIFMSVMSTLQAREIKQWYKYSSPPGSWQGGHRHHEDLTVKAYVPHGAVNGTYYFNTGYGQSFAIITVTNGVSSNTLSNPVTVHFRHDLGSAPSAYSKTLALNYPRATGGPTDVTFETLNFTVNEEWNSPTVANSYIDIGTLELTAPGYGSNDSDKLTIKITGKSYWTESCQLIVGLVESNAFNHVVTIPAIPIGAAAGTFADLTFTWNDTHATDEYFTGKNVRAQIVGSGGVLSEGTVGIPAEDGNGDREVTINFGNFGDGPAIADTPDPTATQPGSTNQALPTPVQETPATPTTSTGKTGVAAAENTSLTRPAVTSTPTTAVANGATTISGTANGATVQDIYNAFKASLMDAGKGGTGGGLGSGSGGAGAPNFADGDFDDPTEGVQSAVDGVVDATTDVMSTLQGKFGTNRMSSLPTSFGSGPSTFPLFSIAGTTAAVNLNSAAANSIFGTMRAAGSFVLAITFAIGCVFTVRRYV